MLKMRISIDSDSILDLMTVSKGMLQEAHEHGLDAVSLSLDYNASDTEEQSWTMRFLIMDDEKQDELDRNMLRVKTLAEKAAEGFKTVDIDDIPF